MRHLISIFMLAILSCKSYGQTYYVTHIEGRVFLEKKELTTKDNVTDITHLKVGKSAKISLFSPTVGRMSIAFRNGKAMHDLNPQHDSELFDIIVKDNILKENSNKILTTRGPDFDIFKFFNQADNTRVLLLTEQYLPARSPSLKMEITDQLQICEIGKNGEKCTSFLRVNGNFFLKHTASDSIVNCRIKLIYGSKQEYFPQILQVSFLSRAALKTLTDQFRAGLINVYQNDKEALIDDIEAELINDYGNFYEPEIRRIILSLIKSYKYL